MKISELVTQCVAAELACSEMGGTIIGCSPVGHSFRVYSGQQGWNTTAEAAASSTSGATQTSTAALRREEPDADAPPPGAAARIGAAALLGESLGTHPYVVLVERVPLSRAQVIACIFDGSRGTDRVDMKIVRQIDRGGFGVVHEVQLDDGSRVARKSFEPLTTAPEDLDKLRKRFQREVRIQSQIDHPNIMPVLDFDLDASPPWFTMPLATQSFEKKIAEDHTSATFDSRPWQDILGAVEELHRLGYVHRDLKPANVLCVKGTWVLSDFGLILPSSRDTTVLTGTRSAYGSLSYAAPEQAQDFRNTPEQADIFALGCILHDAVDPNPRRIPFAQIRVSGPYAPLLEKCTEVVVKRRFQSVAALRSALFDLWRTSHFSPPTDSDGSLLDAVLATPDSIDAWRGLAASLEKSSSREPILRGINGELILRLNAVDELLFGRIVHMMCEWAAGTAFDWDYCDVVGDRLLEAYRLATVRVRCEIVLAALELAISHNRWHVMNQVGAMLSPTADNGLVDRMLIEMNLDFDIEYRLRKIESAIRWKRDGWHEKISTFLTEKDEKLP